MIFKRNLDKYIKIKTCNRLAIFRTRREKKEKFFRILQERKLKNFSPELIFEELPEEKKSKRIQENS